MKLVKVQDTAQGDGTRREAQDTAGLKVQTHLKAGYGVPTLKTVQLQQLALRPVALCG